MKKVTLTYLFFLIAFCVSAQTTGSFQNTISFSEPDYTYIRTLYYHVPTDYDSTQAYKLVVGFRGGPHANAGEFRDQLTFLSDSINAIIVCPENIDHFWNQEGLTKQLFKYSVDTVSSIYNIDSNYIYLTGLSFGGRHSVIVSMDTDNGAIPNIRGVIPFAAGSDSQLEPDYTDIANFPPACICIGLNDNANFINVSNTLHNDIQANGGTSILNEISGVGHTTNFPTYPNEIMECFNYIESQYVSLSIIEPTVPQIGEISIYPNPVNAEFNLVYPEEIQPEQIYVLDVDGRILMSLKPNTQTIDVSALSNGYKTIMVISDTQIFSTQILVQH